MIDRIIRIRNLGRFANYQACGDVTMRKLTLIYGENGRGKTTLCALFRSLQTGHTPPLQARQTLGQDSQPASEILANGQNRQLRNGEWTAQLPEITIFDSEFVHQNIYSGDHIARDHRRNSYRVIIGAQGVQLARQIEQLDADIRTINGNIRQLREQVQRHIEGDMPVEDFLQIPQIADVDALIQAKKIEIQAIASRTQQAAQIQSENHLRTLTAPQLPIGIAEILARTIPDVSAEAEAHVKNHIQRRLDVNGESWLESGTRYVTDGACPFCGQDLDHSDLIVLYQSYFNEAYRKLKQDIFTLPNLVATSLRGNALTNMARTMAANAELMAFWSQFMDLSLPDVPTENLQEVFTNAADALDKSIAAKQQAPLDVAPMPDHWQEFLDQVEVGHLAVESYNQRIQKINAKITALKQPQSQDDLTTANDDLQKLQRAKKRYEPLVVTDCISLANETSRKRQLEDQKLAVRTQLDQYCQEVLLAHQDDINRYLTQFNASFRIANMRHNYVGGTPSSHFQIAINNEAIELGDDRTPETTPCFKTALSAGDRSALALAFFFTTLRRDPNLANRIVILDDPFSSQDRFRRAATQYLIARLAEDCDQVIVLSHDPHFLNAVEQDTHAVGIARLQTSAVGHAVEISPCDLGATIGCPLAAERARLATYVSAGQGAPLDIARTIRPVLEGSLRQAAPNAFNGMNMLGDMINAIRVSAQGDAIYRFAQHVDELDQINRFARAFHHPPGDSSPVPQIDREELKGYASRTLHILGGA
ncbi:MAG: AAA family ATPase [Proteobacteria bacterium]|nr:AAA family ATPase [Pseudomonadota bacterium]